MHRALMYRIRGIHLNGADVQRPPDAVVVTVGRPEILWLLRLNGDPISDNGPLSDSFADGLVPDIEQLAHRPRERWLVEGNIGPGRGDDDDAVNGNSPYRFG
jgi:hypothetical protein